jgi:hypothetical protein
MEKNDANNSPTVRANFILPCASSAILYCAPLWNFKSLLFKVEIWTTQVLRTSLMEVLAMLTAKLASSVERPLN